MREDQKWLEKTAKITTGDRNMSYGHPLGNFLRIAHRQSCTFSKAITVRQVAMSAVDFKMAREGNGFNEDDWVDTMGYAACVERMDVRLKEMGYSGIDYCEPAYLESAGDFLGRMFDLIIHCESYDEKAKEDVEIPF